MATPFSTLNAINGLKTAQMANALFGVTLGQTTNNAVLADIASVGNGITGFNTVFNYYYSFVFGTTPAATMAATVVSNLGITAATVGSQANVDAAVALVTSIITTSPGTEGAALANFLQAFSGFTADVTYGTAATAWNATIATAQAYTASGALNDVLATAPGATTYVLTTAVDAFAGTINADTYMARTLNNVNTLNDGDVIDGGAGVDTLYADLVSQSVAITPIFKNIENVVIRAQSTTADATNGNNMTASTVLIDAQRSLDVNAANTVVAAAGVTHWESNNSRSDVIIEDVRIGTAQKTKDVTIAMVETDAGNVDMGVYFDQLSLRNTGTGTSSLTLRVMDTGAAGNAATAATPLLGNPYDTFKFAADGVLLSIALNTAAAPTAAANADTYPALLTAFQNAIAGTGVTASLGNTFTVTDPISNTQVTGTEIVLTAGPGVVITTPAGSGWFNTTGAAVSPTSNMYTSWTTAATSSTELVTSKVILDDVGRGSTGGDLVIGGMSVGTTSTSRGVERFEIEVRDNSKLQHINSTNNALREVIIVNGVTSNTVANAYTTTTTNAGNLTVNGTAAGFAVDGILAGVNTGSTVSHDGTSGFTDVRVIDGSAMTGQLAFTANVTVDSIGKYINLVDTQAAPGADVANAASAAANANFNVLGANFVYTGGANNDTMTVTIDAAAAASRSSKVSGQSDFTFAIDGGAGNDTITVTVADSGNNGAALNWAANQDLNGNISITGGLGDDTISTPGAGDVTIDAGAGNDVIYTDNTGALTGLTTTGAVNTPSGKAVWAFNTLDQVTTTVAGMAFGARNINDLRSDANTSYNLYKSTVTVSFKGVPAAAVTVNGTGFKTTNLEINQAIKNAINTDATLSKLLVARDGPANSLVVESLIDGAMATGDLTVTIAAPAAAVLTAAEVVSAAAAYGLAVGSTEAQVLTAMGTAVTLLGTNQDYTSQFATDGAVLLGGADSTATSDNIVTGGAGNDVIVLGTNTSGAVAGLSSNEVVTFAAGFGSDVVVNFDATGTGIDHMNLSAFLGTTAVSVGALAATFTDSLVTIAASGATNSTAALVTTLVKTTTDTTTAAASKGVYIVVDANNVGSVYSIVNGAAVGDATATLEGTIDLADTAWGTLTVANFTVPTATAEGSSSVINTLTATANNQALVGSATADTFNTAGFTGVTMTGNAGNDIFTVAAGSTGSVINDLVTGDSFTVAATGGVTAATTGFTATAATTNAAANTAVILNAGAANATISMALAAGTTGYTINGGAGNDTLTGSGFADVITTGAGTNTVTGGAGNDTITGGAGADTINVTGANAGTDTITGFGTGADVIVVGGAPGTTANITTDATWTATAASSNAGTLSFTLGAGANITLTALGGANGATVTGNAAGSTIVGSANADTITSGGGATTITGGAGIDTIAGAAGADTIVIDSALAANADTIGSFTVAQDFLNFSVAGLGLNAADYVAGASTVVNAVGAAALGAGAWNNHIVVDTAANIAGLTVGAGSNAGAVLAIASDTGAISYDLDGNFAAGVVVIGTVTGGGAFTAAELVLIA